MSGLREAPSDAIGDDQPIDVGLSDGEPVCRNSRVIVVAKMDCGKTVKTGWTNRSNLYLAAFSANLLFISTGCALTWTSPAITKLQDQNLTDYDITWISSIQPIGAIFGPALFSLSLDRFGRKWSLILNAATFLLSWLMLGTSMKYVEVLKVGRFIGGLGVGASFNSIPVYITEIADVDSRQMLTSMTELFIAAGYVLTYSTGPFVDFVSLAVICALPAIVFIGVMLTMPESPYHSVAISKRDEAFKTLMWLRGDTVINAELDMIEAAVEEAKQFTGEKKDLFLKRGPRTGLILTIMMLFIQQVSAVDVITTYTEQIFNNTNVPLSPSLSAIVVGVVNLVSSFGAPLVVKRWGSKPVLVVCAFICGLALLSFGSYQYLDEHDVCDLSAVSVIPLICILVFNVFFCIGLGSLPWAISAELFPPSLKGFALLLSSGAAWTFSFILIFSYGGLHSIIGTSTLFFFYGTCVVIGSFLIANFVPDTNGKSLKEITDRLENGSKK